MGQNLDSSSNDLVLLEDKLKQHQSQELASQQKHDSLKNELEESRLILQKWVKIHKTLSSNDKSISLLLLIIESIAIIIGIIAILQHNVSMGAYAVLLIFGFLALMILYWKIIYSVGEKARLYSTILQSKLAEEEVVSAELERLQVEAANLRSKIAQIQQRITLETEMKQKGLISFVDRLGVEKWGTPEEVKLWSEKDFEESQIEKGLVKYEDKWLTPMEKLNAERAKFETEQKEKGLVKFVSWQGRESWGTPEQVKKWAKWDIDMENHFQRMPPREFEKLINRLFLAMGYSSILSQHVGDYGADIVAEKGGDRIAVQVKRYAADNKVGSPDVQIVLGSMFKYKANKAILVTTSDFTDAARKQARDAPIELWNYRMLCEKIEKYLLDMKRD